MHYWIDGYNLLFHISSSKASFRKKREDLIIELNTQATRLNIQITIIFDAFDKEKNLDMRTHYGDLEIIYSTSKQTADESILDSIERSRSPSNICVVTADNDLARKAKALKANILSLKEFLGFLKKREKKATQNSLEWMDSPKEISRLLNIFERKLKEKPQP